MDNKKLSPEQRLSKLEQNFEIFKGEIRGEISIFKGEIRGEISKFSKKLDAILKHFGVR